MGQADVEDGLALGGFDDVQRDELLKLEGVQAYLDGAKAVVIAVSSQRAQAREALREKEHRELLLILQEALIDVASRDSDMASKLAARAYINLKTDPTGQRRYDGLLHRFTGVLHRSPKKEDSAHSE